MTNTETPWRITTATTQLQSDLAAAIDRLAYTDPQSPLYSHERGYIAGLRSALVNLGIDPDDLPATPPRELRRPADQTEQLTHVSDHHA